MLLAGKCITECDEISDPLIVQITDDIYQFWLSYLKLEFISSVVVAIAQTYAKLAQKLHTALQDQDQVVSVRRDAAEALGEIGSPACLEKLLQSTQIDIYRSHIFALARSLAIRFSKEKLPFIPVYPELVNAIFCNQCNHPNPTDGKFCAKCGKELRSNSFK